MRRLAGVFLVFFTVFAVSSCNQLIENIEIIPEKKDPVVAAYKGTIKGEKEGEISFTLRESSHIDGDMHFSGNDIHMFHSYLNDNNEFRVAKPGGLVLQVKVYEKYFEGTWQYDLKRGTLEGIRK